MVSQAQQRARSPSEGTSEGALFRQFGSKTTLFGASVIEPFSSFILNYSEAWTTTEEPHPAEIPTREFVRQLYPMLREQRDIVLTLMAAEQHERGVQVETSLATTLECLEWVLFRTGGPPDERIIDEMVGILLRGISGGHTDMTADMCTVVDQPDRRRVEFSDAAHTALLREASDWLMRSGRTADDMS